MYVPGNTFPDADNLRSISLVLSGKACYKACHDETTIKSARETSSLTEQQPAIRQGAKAWMMGFSTKERTPIGHRWACVLLLFVEFLISEGVNTMTTFESTSLLCAGIQPSASRAGLVVFEYGSRKKKTKRQELLEVRINPGQSKFTGTI